jgi:hypothetical protein
VLDEPEEKHLHYVFWDLDNCTLNEAIEVLRKIQFDFKLGDIFILSDAEKSFRAWCWSKRPWITYLHVLIHTLEAGILDYGFWVWTVRRGSATLRTSDKIDRENQKLVAILKGYEPTTLAEKLTYVIYDTGIEKRGKVIFIG